MAFPLTLAPSASLPFRNALALCNFVRTSQLLFPRDARSLTFYPKFHLARCILSFPPYLIGE